MKKTQRKDAWKNILKQKVSFLSIIVIAAMAVMAYLGLNFAARALADNANRFFESTAFRDAEIVSTLLLSDDDLNTLRSVQGVSDVEAVWQSSGTLLKDEAKKDVTVRSLTERINIPLLVSGRLPETESECLLDWEIADALSLREGDTVRIERAQYLRTDSFTVCGIAKNSEYATKEMYTPGDRNMIVLPSAFDLDALDGCCMKALLRFECCVGVNRFDEAFLTASSEMMQRIETLSGELAAKRTDEVRSAYDRRITDGERELSDAQQELSDAREELDNGWAEWENGEKQAEEAKRRLDDAARQIADASKQFSEGERALSDGNWQTDDAQSLLDKAHSLLAAGQEELENSKTLLEDARRQLDQGWAEYRRNEALLADAERQLADGKTQLDDGQKELDEAETQLVDARRQLDDGWAEYSKNEALLSDAEQQLADGKKQLEDGQKELDDAQAQLADARRQLDDGWAEYRENEALLADARRQLDDGEAQYQAAGRQLEEGRNALIAGYAEAREGREQLVSSYELIEDGKETARNALKAALDSVIRDDTLNYGIVWSQRSSPVDPDSQTAGATDFCVTDYPRITIDLNNSLEGNLAAYVTKVLEACGISDEALTERLIEQFGPEVLLPDESAVQAAIRAIMTLYSGYPELLESYQTLADGARAWNAGHAQYLEGLETLAEGEAEYQNALRQYEDARRELDTGWKQYYDGARQLAAGLATLTQGEADYESGLAEYEAGKTRLAEGRAEYNDKLKLYDDGAAQLAAGLATLRQSEAEYAKGLEQYESGKSLLTRFADGLAEYETGTQQYQEGRRELDDGRAELEEGERRYAEGMAEYLTGAQTLADARIALDEMDECRWVILDVNGNASYQAIRATSENDADLGMTFALIFILVGALVIYATLGRIVEEQRRLVGATRALGLYKREILAKYMVFGIGATLIGMLIGVVCGCFLIQPILTFSHGRFYCYDNSAVAFVPGMTLLVLLGGVALAALAVWSACSELMRATATSLMQEKAPASGKKSGRASKLSLYARLILLNIRTDKKRVAVTVVSVAGCCALLVAGFTMRNGIVSAIEKQFSDIVLYDYSAVFSDDDADSSIPLTRKELEAAGADATAVYAENQLFSINGNLNAAVLYCGDLEEMRDDYALLDPESNAALPPDPQGVWINLKTAEVNHLRAGDTITLYDGGMRPYSAPIAGIMNNYIRIDILMSRESYAQIFGAQPKDNTLLIRCGNALPEQVDEILSSSDGVASVTTSASQLAETMDLAKVLNMIALLMVGIAGIMACFILLNLISMHVNQKKRELTIMRVNGFTVREVIAYIARETVVTNLIGILLGLGAGMLLGYRTVCLLEGSTAHFDHSVQPMALILAVLITAGFSVILNVIALRKVKDLKLTDVA